MDKPVTIKNIEYSIVERAWEEGWITPRIPQYRSGMSVAVVGSGPSGAVCVLGVIDVCVYVCVGGRRRLGPLRCGLRHGYD